MLKETNVDNMFNIFNSIIESLKINTKYDELLKILLEKIIEITNGKIGFILIKDIQSNPYKINSAKEIKNDQIKSIIKNHNNILKNVFKNGKTEIVKFSNSISNNDLNGILLPIKTDETVTSILFAEITDKNNFNETSYNFINTISELASKSISKMLIYDTLKEKIKLKDLLITISNSIEKVFSLKDVFDVVMKKLAENFNIMRGMLVLFDANNLNELSVFSAYNLTDEEISRGIYKVGEGIIGKVVENGKPISIADINKDDVFLNRMKIKRDKNIEISFIAVPIKISGIVLGVLAIEKYFETTEKLKDEEDILFLINGIIANKVKIYQKMTEEKSVLLKENLNLKKELYDKYGINNIIGKNKKMLEIFELIKMVADSISSILILGESGTGKELVAKSLHFNSSRKYSPFVSINCSAIPENLLESELFGYKKGAFTGAGTDKKGKFLLADGGTLFLDEIGEMPLNLQVKLLRAIQEKEIEPVGSEFRIKIDIRILSATNKDPIDLIKSGKLREDLYYRLNVIEIKLPPLKERKDDIPLLIHHFIEKYSKINNRDIKWISHEALKMLQSYHWAGNVRELENVIERAILLSKENTIEVHDLPAFIINAERYQSEEISIEKWIDGFLKNEKDNGNAYKNFMDIIEKEFLTKALLHNKRNKIKTSRFLGINRNTLRTKISLYNIKV